MSTVKSRKRLPQNFLRRFCTALLLSTLHLSTPTNGDEILDGSSITAGGTANEENLQGEKTAFACQGTRLHLKCLNQSEVIKVTRANYGRFSIAVCNDKSMTTWSVNCFSSKAKEVFASNCNNFAECHILAEDFDFGPNPCPDTERYLEASYVCVPRSQNYHEGQSPLWTRNKETRTSLNSVRRKPQRRVPITAPPPVASSSTTFSSGDTSTAVMMMTTSEELTSPATPISTFSYTFLPKSISSSTVKTIVGCGSVAKRGIAWPFTPAGSVSVKTCSKGTKATWFCQSSGVWSPSGPDLSNCQGKKWKLRPPTELENLVGSGTINLYGGDIVPLLDLVASLTDQFRSTRSSETNARSLARTLSLLLDHRLFPMWEDLQKEPRLLRSAVRRFMEVTEQLGYAMGEEKLEEDVVVVVTSNIYLAIKKQNPTEQAPNMVSWQFPPRFSLVNQNYSHNEFKERTTDSAAAALTSSTVSIHLPGAAAAAAASSLKSRKIVKNHVVFLSFRGLAPILQSHSADPILSLGVDPSLKQLLQARIRLPSSSSYSSSEGLGDANPMEVKEMHCYDALLQEKMGCNVAKWHNGTRECVCNGWLRGYALNVTMASSASSASMFDDVMMDLREELDGQTLLEEAMTTTMLVIVAVSATLLVASLLSAALLIIYCRRVKIQDKKWEEERHQHQPWWLQNNRSKSSPASDSTGHQDSSGNGSIQTSSTLLLNSNRNYTSSLISSASIISPYESAPHFHATLNAHHSSHHLKRCPKNSQESSTWRRLLSSLKEPNGSRPKSGVTSNHHLTLGNHHNHHLNPENTLRLATHRQLFQFNNVSSGGAAAADDHYDLHRSATAGQDNNLFDGLGGHRSNESGLQYYASENKGLNSSHHSSSAASSRWPPLLHPQTEAQIYQVPVDLEPPNYSRPLLNPNATRTMQERQQSRQTRLSHSAFVRSRQHSHGSPPPTSSAATAAAAAAMAAEDLWLLQQNEFQVLSKSHARPNSHIYMDLDSSSSSESGIGNGPGTTATTTRKSLSNYVVSQC